MSNVIVQGNASGTGTTTIQSANTSASTTFTLPGTDGSSGQALTTNGSGALSFSTVGYQNVPQSGSAKTTSYTLATGDIGEFIQVSTGGSIVIPDATFAAGDVVSIFNNTSGNITITCSITTAYIAGTDSDKATMTLATRGVATVLFISGTVCVVTGNVS